MGTPAREFVRQRAGYRCEYCRLPQDASQLRFHIEHILPRQHGGDDEPGNLALACPECNLRKGPNVADVCPATGAIVGLFHPRRDKWSDHFALEGVFIIGRTDAGQATVQLLAMNAIDRVQMRELLQQAGRL